MTSKALVASAIQGREPPRVPIGFFAVDFDTVQKILGHETYLRAKGKSCIAFWEGRHDEVADSYMKDHIELHEKLDLDLVTFPKATWRIPEPNDDPPPRKVDDTTWEDQAGRVYKYSEVTADITCVLDPVRDRQAFTRDQFQREPDVTPPSDRSWRVYDTVVQRFKHDKFICGDSGGEVGMLFLGGMARGCMTLIDQPDVVKAAVHYTLRQQALTDDHTVHPDADAVLWSSDFGYKSGPFINPSMFTEFFLEANRERVRRMHARGLKVVKHCCGNNNALLDDFIDIGYDVYQSIQPTADMDICRVKRSHGDRITLWGGVAVEHLVSGTPEDVRRDVRRAIECARTGGRFILGTSHSVAVGSRYDNFMAMLDEYHKHA